MKIFLSGYGRMGKMIETLALEIELDGEDMYLCMDVACYDGKWYCLTQGGMIGSLMGIPMLHGGVAIE